MRTGTSQAIKDSDVQVMARHDLLWKGIGGFGIATPKGVYPGLATDYTKASIDKALALRAKLRQANPAILMLAEIRYYADPDGYLPADSPWWMRDSQGNRVAEGNGTNPTTYYRLDLHNADLQASVGKLCALAMQTGVVDGCFLDWWDNRVDEREARLAIAKQVRMALGDKGLLIVNVNGRQPFAESQPLINGLYMEGFNSSFFPITAWRDAVAAMQLARNGALKVPSFTAFEGWSSGNVMDRNSYQTMRLTTTLSLVFSDGYVLYGDPNPLPATDHLHDLYLPFWSDLAGHRPLGLPIEPPKDRSRGDGAFQREFVNGTVVFNPPDNGAVSVTFDADRTSLGSGTRGTSFTVNAGDGDLFVR